jgi:hypothetical protein
VHRRGIEQPLYNCLEPLGILGFSLALGFIGRRHMHLVYIDDSYERPCLTIAAIAIPAATWRYCFTRVQSWRRSLKRSDGILINREFHATEFVAGRGRLGPRIVTKHRRSQIFHSAFELMNDIQTLRVSRHVEKTIPNGLSKDCLLESTKQWRHGIPMRC